ncbi:MAG TPA: sugar phosphate isomerase/epimerase family protein [Terriglobales bacterium]|nr:sugar phosphate isomerase/epimerase family protein [Terriglobales bacterium]
MSPLSRRSFLKNSFGAAAAASAYAAVPAVLGGRLEAAAAGPHMTFPTAPRERISVASWPFRFWIDSPTNTYRDRSKPGMTLLEFPAMVVKEFKVNKLEPLGQHFASTDAGYLGVFREAVRKAGCHIVDIPMGGEESYYDPDPKVRQKAIDLGKKWVDIAVAVGSPSIRNHIGGAKNVKPDVARTAESLGQVVKYAASRNVVVNLENDDLVSEDAFFLVNVIKKVNSPWLHALPDFCNSMMGGDADFDYKAVTAMFGHAYNICHVKDSEVGDGGKEYRIDIPKTFGILKASGFRGYCSMEWEGAGDSYQGTHKLIADTLKYL